MEANHITVMYLLCSYLVKPFIKTTKPKQLTRGFGEIIRIIFKREKDQNDKG